MVIRIALRREDSRTIVSVAGRLEAKHLAELEEHCTSAPAEVVFDLSELRTADEESLRWLCRQVEQGARVTGASPYIRLQLERGQKGSKGETSAGNSRGSHG